MNLTQLRAFDAVARLGSVTRAATSLNVSPAAVSLHVRQLERSCGIALVERVRRQLRLSAAGRALHDYSRRIFSLADEADAAVGLMRDLRAGALRLAATDTPARSWAPVILAAFLRRYPGVRVQVHIGNTRQVVERLAARDDDVAVVAAAIEHSDLVVESIASDPIVVIVPRGHDWRRRETVTLRDLVTQPLVLRELGSSTRRLIEAEFGRRGLQPEIVMELGSHDAIIGAVEHGIGISLLPLSLVRRDARRGTVHTLGVRGVRLRHPISVVYHAQRAAFPLTHRLLEVVHTLRRAGAFKGYPGSA
jgi:DNA-binding transcriptional LysR family regulator